MLQVQNISTSYGAVQALRGVSLDVQAGEIVTLVGANGAGKSTLLNSICGVCRINAGAIVYQGRRLDGQPVHTIARQGIAQSPEGRRVFPRMTVHDNLVIGAGAECEKAVLQQRLQAQFELFPRLHDRLQQRAGTLSGGEQQMLAIARALMAAPQLLLLDEPSLGLAPLIVKDIFAAITRVNREQGMTVLLVEQNAYQALRLSNRGYVMVNGVIEMQGPSAELLKNPAVRSAYLEGAVA